jgi:hypothetical protein
LRGCLRVSRSALTLFKINCRDLGGLGGLLILQECLLENSLQRRGRPGRLNTVLVLKLAGLNCLRFHPGDLRGGLGLSEMWLGLRIANFVV